MKNFILLTLSSLIVIIAILLGLKWSLTNHTKINENRNILLGDSHVEYVANRNTTNFSSPGAYMKVLYKGIEKLDLENKNVYVAVGPHSFADFRTSRYDSVQKYKNILYTMDTLIPRRINLYHSTLSLPISGKELVRSAHIYRPKRVRKRKSNLSDSLMKKTIKRHYPKQYTRDTTELKWFKELIRLVENNGANVILLEMPLHPKYLKKIPLKYKNRYDSILADFDTIIKFHEVPDSLFRDGDHILPKYQSSLFNSIIN
ncbi:MAG TPA: hypothetical protein DEQ46_08260 [Cryomorphaceae bacterium]|jgi:hypothetical protein|nr:hypothetical protein [Schleiferiaceae bacterium]HCD48608.1 hypothetical protein [Cryomorphaceae bacterium]